jgi:hypothetical protein
LPPSSPTSPSCHREKDVELAITDANGYDDLAPDATIEIYNQTYSGATIHFASNLQAVTELGYNWPYRKKRQSGNAPSASECYNPISIPGPKDEIIPYPGMDGEPQVLEMILWQNLSAKDTSLDDVDNPPTLNFTLPDPLPERLGAYKTSDERNITPPTAMAAIRVRCTSSSSVGTAHLDGRRAVFSDFQRSDETPAASRSPMHCAERLSLGVPRLIFLAAAGARPPPRPSGCRTFTRSVGRFAQGHARLGTHFIGNLVPLQSAYLQAEEELRRSLTRAHAVYARCNWCIMMAWAMWIGTGRIGRRASL